MHRKTSKFRKRAELSLIYSLMALAVVGVVAVLIMVMQGYRFNRYDGKIEQGGLLKYDSQPDGGTVYIDDLRLANQTPNKITTSAGAHTVKMTKPGYIDWKKDVTIKAGGILWLNYTRFIPEKRTTTPVISLTDLSGALISRDKKRAVVKESAQTPEVSLITLESDSPVKTVMQFAEGDYTKAADPASVSFSLKEWDRDGRHVLMRHVYDEKAEWLVFDTRDKRIVNNLSTLSSLDIHDASFSYGNNRVVYVVTGANELRRIDLGNGGVSEALLTHVETFTQYDRSTIVYTSLLDPVSKQRSVGYLTNGAKKPRVLRSYADDGQPVLRLDLGRYYNENYAVIAYGETVDIMKGDLPSSDNDTPSAMTRIATLTVPGGATYVGFSPDENRHIYAHNAQKIVTYDLELEKSSTTSFVAAHDARIRWVDRYHFATTVGGQLMLYEFDGQNATAISDQVLAYQADFSSNNKYMYLFTTLDGKPVLGRVQLEL